MYTDLRSYLIRYPWKAKACPICGELFLKHGQQATCRDPVKNCAAIYKKRYEKARRARAKIMHPHYHRDYQRKRRAAAKARKTKG